MQSLLHDRVSLTLTASFFLGLELLTIVSSSYWPLFTLCILFLLFGTILSQREDIRHRGPHVLILPLAYIGSVFLFHLFVSQGFFQQAFIFLATIGFFLLVARGIEWSFPTWNWLFTSGTFFLFTAGAYGLYFHLRFPVWGVVLLVGGMTFLLSLHVLGRAELLPARRVFWSALMTLFMCELLVGFSLLPVSYLVASGALFMAFYVLLHLLQRYLYGRLTTVLVGEYLLLGTIAWVIVLGTARWTIL